MTAEPPAPAPPPAPEPPEPTGLRGRRIAIAFGMLVAVIAIYVFSLIGVHLLAKSSPPLPEVDLSQYQQDETAVKLRVEEMKTVANRLVVNVLVYPSYSIYDEKFGVLTADAAVRLYPENDLGDQQYPKGKAPAQVATTIEAHGNPGNWPFDTYKTDTIQADVLVGVGDDRQYKPARVEVTGLLEGWDVTVTRVGPTLALFVAIQILTSRRQFLPPFSTWYAPMLFAVVPLRNILPGTPPAGAWIEQAVVIWVLIALATALVLYIMAWYRHPS